jgi:hypothetical protein
LHLPPEWSCSHPQIKLLKHSTITHMSSIIPLIDRILGDEEIDDAEEFDD